MIKNYFLATYKNLKRQKVFALINILGLAIGLCVFMLVSLYVESELSYDKQWESADRILRLNMHLRPDSLDPVAESLTPYLVMPPIQQYFSDEIALSARRVFRGLAVLVEEESYSGGMWLYERDFIDIFKFDVVEGSLEATMENPGRIALSESSALKYFGKEGALGRTLSLEVPEVGLVDYLVTAVYRLPAGESSLDFPSIALFDESAMTERAEGLKSWGPGGWVVTNYFLLKPEVDFAIMNLQMAEFMDQHVPPRTDSDEYSLSFQKLTDIHFSPNRGEQGGDKTQFTVFSIIGILVLLVGSINFVILTTANSIGRRQEVGVRKVAGATKAQLVFQFLGESMLLTFVALIIALMLLEISLPLFVGLIGHTLEIYYLKFSNILFLALLVTVVGGLGGLYPALILANTKPAGMLSEIGNGAFIGSISTRSVLAGFQFSIVIFLLITTLVLHAQLSYYQNRDHGFNPQNLIALERPEGPSSEVEPVTSLLIAEIEKLSGVESVGLSRNQANDSLSNLPAIPLTNEFTGTTAVNSIGLFVGYNFFKTYEIPLLAGRTYDAVLDTPGSLPSARKIVINRFAATALGFASPEAAIAQQISYGEIIGVVENSQFLSFRRERNAEIYPLITRYSQIITVRFHESYASTINAEIQTVWRNVVGDEPLNSNFVAQRLQQVFSQEENEGKFLIVLSLLSILVSCMGLYGLVAFAVRRQVKEIGIRKVLGAEFSSILKLFLWQFTKPVLIANILAWPLALWAMLNWLQSFPYQINSMLLLPLCAIAGLLALLIACITVSSTVAKSANAKPVLALRYE